MFPHKLLDDTSLPHPYFSLQAKWGAAEAEAGELSIVAD